jgi:two-component system, NtrC family, nitrogen regulation response regulator NtrX
MSAPHILVVDDEADIRSTLREVLSDEGFEVEAAADAAQARAARTRSEPDLILLDIWMPDTDGITLLREWAGQGGATCPVVMMSGHGTVETAVEATRLGAFDFIEKPLSLTKLLRVVERALESGRRRRTATRALLPPIVTPVGKSRLMQQLREAVQRASTHDSAVLFVGETGTGREAFARYLHSLSARARLPFVSIAGGSLDDAGVVERLRGREREGVVEPGLYDEARGGTLYLDGLEDFSPAAQRVLAADLSTGAYVRAGGAHSQSLDVRIISSAQPGLELKRSPEPFRQDLLDHLALITLRVPPLRDYAEDVPELLRHYVDRLVDEQGLSFRRFGVAAQNRLRNYPWPGNLSELNNLVRRLLLVGGDEEIRLNEIEHELATQLPRDEPLVKQDLLALPLREAREAFERAYLQQQLLLCNGKVGQLAKRVGMERTHLYRKLRSLGIDFRHGGDD